MSNQSTAIRAGNEHGYIEVTNTLGASVMKRAKANIREQLQRAGTNEFSKIQIEALEQVEALKLVNGLDLYSVLLRYRFLRNIRDRNLISIHPGRYVGLREMANQQGISMSELHDILRMGDVIFPFVASEYGDDAVANMWEALGTARMREVTATLVSAITGNRSQSENVRRAIATAEGIVAQQYETESGYPWENIEPQERNRLIAREIIRIAEHASNVREMRFALRGTQTNGITFLYHSIENGRHLLMAEINDSQRTMIDHLMPGRVDFQDAGQVDGDYDIPNILPNTWARLEQGHLPDEERWTAE